MAEHGGMPRCGQRSTGQRPDTLQSPGCLTCIQHTNAVRPFTRNHFRWITFGHFALRSASAARTGRKAVHVLDPSQSAAQGGGAFPM